MDRFKTDELGAVKWAVIDAAARQLAGILIRKGETQLQKKTKKEFEADKQKVIRGLEILRAMPEEDHMTVFETVSAAILLEVRYWRGLTDDFRKDDSADEPPSAHYDRIKAAFDESDGSCYFCRELDVNAEPFGGREAGHNICLTCQLKLMSFNNWSKAWREKNDVSWKNCTIH